MPTLQELDQVNINGNYIARDQTVFEVSGLGIVTTDITSVLTSIEYKETMETEMPTAFGSKRPAGIVSGNITGEGTLIVSDAGLDVFNKIALNSGLPGILYLGLAGGMDITISYTTQNGLVKTDRLERVLISDYSNGVNKNDLIYEREFTLKIAKISLGTIA